MCMLMGQPLSCLLAVYAERLVPMCGSIFRFVVLALTPRVCSMLESQDIDAAYVFGDIGELGDDLSSLLVPD